MPFKNTLGRLILPYRTARETVEAGSQRIYNATEGGALEVFERRALEKVVSGAAGTEMNGTDAAADTPLSFRLVEFLDGGFLDSSETDPARFSDRLKQAGGASGGSAGAYQALVLFDDPAAVIGAALKDGSGPQAALDAWLTGARTCLDLLRRNRQHLTLIERAAARSDKTGLTDVLKTRFQGQDLPSGWLDAAEDPDPVLAVMATALLGQSLDAQRLLAELRVSAQRLTRAQVPPGADMETALSQYQASSAQAGEAEAHRRKLALRERELERVQAQLAQLQDLLRAERARTEQQTRDLREAQADAAQSRAAAKAYDARGQEYFERIKEAQAQFDDAAAEIDRQHAFSSNLTTRVESMQSQLAETQIAAQKVRSEAEQARQTAQQAQMDMQTARQETQRALADTQTARQATQQAVADTRAARYETQKAQAEMEQGRLREAGQTQQLTQLRQTAQDHFNQSETLRTKLQASTAAHKTERQAHEGLRFELDSVYLSTSWRATRPLRHLSRLLRRLRSNDTTSG